MSAETTIGKECHGCGRCVDYRATPTIWGVVDLCGPCRIGYRQAVVAAVRRFNRSEATGQAA